MVVFRNMKLDNPIFPNNVKYIQQIFFLPLSSWMCPLLMSVFPSLSLFCNPLVLSQILPVSFSFSFLPRNCRYNRLCKYCCVLFFFPFLFLLWDKFRVQFTLSCWIPNIPSRWVWQAAAAERVKASETPQILAGLLADRDGHFVVQI